MCLSCEQKPIYFVEGEPGLVPQITCWERRAANIDLVSRAYDAAYEAMNACSSLVLMVQLDDRLKLLGESLDELMRERQAWQERQALRKKEQSRGPE